MQIKIRTNDSGGAQVQVVNPGAENEVVQSVSLEPDVELVVTAVSAHEPGDIQLSEVTAIESNETSGGDDYRVAASLIENRVGLGAGTESRQNETGQRIATADAQSSHSAAGTASAESNAEEVEQLRNVAARIKMSPARRPPTQGQTEDAESVIDAAKRLEIVEAERDEWEERARQVSEESFAAQEERAQAVERFKERLLSMPAVEAARLELVKRGWDDAESRIADFEFPRGCATLAEATKATAGICEDLLAAISSASEEEGSE